MPAGVLAGPGGGARVRRDVLLPGSTPRRAPRARAVSHSVDGHRRLTLNTQNKGVKELKDILDCITHFEIKDTDFIVKMTGRYVLNDDSEFMNVIKDTSCDCVIKYGSYLKPLDYKVNDCITGLIGMRCEYVKKIEFPVGLDCLEWSWAKATDFIDDKKIHIVDKLGISICPGCDTYFDV